VPGGGSLLGLPGVHPLLDGATPVFWQTGADPTVSPGLDLPIKSVAKFGALYFEKWGPQPTDWAEVAEPAGGGLDFTSFMRGPNTTGDMGYTLASPVAANDTVGTIIYPVNVGANASINLNTGMQINAVQQPISANIVAVPMILPAGRVKYFVINLTAAPIATAAPFVMLGIYGSRGTADQFKYSPGAQLYQSSFIDVKAADVATFRVFNRGEIDVEIPSPGVYHFAMAGTSDSATQQIGGNAQSAFNRFLGMRAKWGNGQPNYNDSMVIGHSRAYLLVSGLLETLPDPFYTTTPDAENKYLYYKNTGGTIDIPQFFIGFEVAE
jgi:hypothetical protein